MTSNLINIKVQGENIGIKEEILDELKSLREKVTLLENKSYDISSIIHKNSPNRTNKFNIIAAELMAESKVENHSNLIFS